MLVVPPTPVFNHRGGSTTTAPTGIETASNLFTSELVLYEARQGDPLLAKKRLDFLRGISELRITNEVYDLANALLQKVLCHKGPERMDCTLP